MEGIKYYTGIGSRETPQDIQETMKRVAKYLWSIGYTLRSGKAPGADSAFQLGVQNDHFKTGAGSAEIYIPWEGFKGGTNLWDYWDISDYPKECFDIASTIHPAWNKYSQGAKRLHARNVCQILGKDLNTPSDFVLYWANEVNSVVKGGTATAVHLARKHNIPTINMRFDGWRTELLNILKENK